MGKDKNSQRFGFSQEENLFKDFTSKLTEGKKKGKENVIRNINEFEKLKKIIQKHLSEAQKNKGSVYDFVKYVLDLIAFISQRRLDPVMTSIALETKCLLDNLKTNYDESSDYLSSDEDSEDGDSGEEACLGGKGLDWTGNEGNVGGIKFLEDDKEGGKDAKEARQVSSFEKTNYSLSIVEERTDESEEEIFEKKIIYNPHYTSKINFGNLFNSSNFQNILQKWKDPQYLTTNDLQKNYIVHFIDKSDSDFRLAIQFLKSMKTTAMTIESKNGVPGYIQFTGKSICYIFKLKELSKNQEFKEFFAEFMCNRKNLKIVFDFKPFSKLLVSLSKGYSHIGGINCQSVYEIKENLFTEKNKKNVSINFCCLRLFGKEINDVYKSWALDIVSLGLNEIHYFSVKALSVYMIYLRLKMSQKVTLQKNRFFMNGFDKESSILVDSSCGESATSILDKLGCMYNQLPLRSYKELSCIIKSKQESLLVSDDKFLLSCFGVKNRLIFVDKKSFKKDIEKILMLKKELN